jgi:phage terminase Nu1 subunit (DNA packaging protein)
MNDNIDINNAKYEEALEYLRGRDEAEGGGSYNEEVATIIEELLFRVNELQEAAAPTKRLTKAQREAAALRNAQQTNAAIFYSTRMLKSGGT